MDAVYKIKDTSDIYSPALIYYPSLIRKNLQRMIEIAGSVDKLRPHCKTHKTREITRMSLEMGITRQKCATIAEAEMLAECGMPDVILAYSLVGPNCRRYAELLKKFPNCRFAVLADDIDAARELSQTMTANSLSTPVLMDVDVGQQRTGIPPGEKAAALYRSLAELPGLKPDGLHVYDGHNHQGDADERATAVAKQMQAVCAMRDELKKSGVAVPRLVLGGTPTFAIHAKMNLPDAEYSPGTCILHDHGYGSRFPDLTGFKQAALLLTRVISRPSANRITLDLGYKAVASDPPADNRCVLLNVPDYKPVLQNEEHLVVETPAADRFPPGSEVYAMPTHICPTSAMHRFAYVVGDGVVTGKWEIAARDRVLTV